MKRIELHIDTNYSGKLRSHKDDSNGKTGIYILGKRKTGWQAFRWFAVRFFVLGIVLYFLIADRL